MPTHKRTSATRAARVESPLLSQLKHETATLHARLERGLSLMDRGLSRARYEAILGTFYGYYAPLEERLAAIDGWGRIGIELDRRRKAHLLRRDLEFFALAAGEQPRCSHLPPTRSLSDGLGCLYVLEGATLGAQIISPHLSRQLGLSADRGGAFFNAYGPDTAEMWGGFTRALAAYPADPEESAGIVAAACATFLELERWVRERSLFQG